MAAKRGWSQWELDELVALQEAGWSVSRLADLYGVSERTITRMLRRLGERKVVA